MTSRSFTIPGQVRQPLMLKVRQVHSASRFAFLRSRFGAPKAIVGEAIGQVAQSNFGTVFCGEPSSRYEPLREQTRQAMRTTTKG